MEWVKVARCEQLLDRAINHRTEQGWPFFSPCMYLGSWSGVGWHASNRWVRDRSWILLPKGNKINRYAHLSTSAFSFWDMTWISKNTPPPFFPVAYRISIPGLDTSQGSQLSTEIHKYLLLLLPRPYPGLVSHFSLFVAADFQHDFCS